ncbi:hypothetical protein RMATCC62417_00314 [Rhizopus microsporus]|nr:hypothetical protein RMATCC62417_00314 [Rhizopus microsporus]
MADYELPSMYTKDSRYDYPEIDDVNDTTRINIASSSGLQIQESFRDAHVEDNRLAWLLLVTSFFILIWTVIPVVTDMGYITPWFPGDSLWRLFDPVITLPLSLFVMTRADVMNTGGRPHFCGPLSERSVAWLLWSIGAGIYVQGHGIHLAAAMFKHPVQNFNLAHPELVAQYPVLEEIYSNMRDLWEHVIAHYMYAGGAMVMSWVQLFVYRNQVHGPLSRGTTIVWCIGSVVYGLLIAGVAIEFPSGLIVGLIYCIVIGLVAVCMMLFNKMNLPKGGIFTAGRRMANMVY